MNPAEILAEIEKALDGSANAEALEEIRATLDDPAFLEAIKEYLRGVNDPDVKIAILKQLNAVKRRSGELSAERKNQLTNLRYGIGAGSAATASSIIAMAAAGAIGGVFLIPMLGGIWVAFTCTRNTSPMAKEEQLYQDINGQAAKILEKVDAPK